MKLNLLESLNINPFLLSIIILTTLYIVFLNYNMDLLKIFDEKENYQNNNPVLFYTAIGLFIYVYLLLISCDNENFTNTNLDFNNLQNIMSNNPDKLFRFKTTITTTNDNNDVNIQDYYLTLLDKEKCIEPDDVQTGAFEFNRSCNEKILILKNVEDVNENYNDYVKEINIRRRTCSYDNNVRDGACYDNDGDFKDDTNCMELVENCDYKPQYIHDFKLEKDDDVDKIYMYGFNEDIYDKDHSPVSILNMNQFNPDASDTYNELVTHNQVCGNTEHSTENDHDDNIYFEFDHLANNNDDQLVGNSEPHLPDINTGNKVYLYVKKNKNNTLTNFYLCKCIKVMCLTENNNYQSGRKTYFAICLKEKVNGEYPPGALKFDLLTNNHNFIPE